MSDTVDDAVTQSAANDGDASSQPAAASAGNTSSQSAPATAGDAVAAAASGASGGDAPQLSDAHCAWIEQMCGKNPNAAAGVAVGAISAGAVDGGDAGSGGLLSSVANAVSSVGNAVSGVVGAVETAASDVAGAVSNVAGAAVNKAGAVASDVGQAVEGAAGTVGSGVEKAAEDGGGFLKGMAEGVYDGVKGVATGVVHGVESVAKEGYALATDADARTQALDTVEHGAEAVGGFLKTAVTDPGKAAGEVVDAASSAASSVGNMAKAAYKSFEEAEAAGHGAEWLGKGIGEAGVLVGGALLTDGGSLAAEGGAATAEGVALLGEGTEVAGQLGAASSLASGAGDAGSLAAQAAATGDAAVAAGGMESTAALARGADEAGTLAGQTGDAAAKLEQAVGEGERYPDLATKGGGKLPEQAAAAGTEEATEEAVAERGEQKLAQGSTGGEPLPQGSGGGAGDGAGGAEPPSDAVPPDEPPASGGGPPSEPPADRRQEIMEEFGELQERYGGQQLEVEDGTLSFDSDGPNRIPELDPSDELAEEIERNMPEAAEAARPVLDKAKAAEPGITQSVQGATEQYGGKMIGLQHKLKTEGSLTRKIATDLAVSEKAISGEEAAANVADAIRYTSCFPPDKLVEGAQATLAKMQQEGNEIIQLKNTWLDPESSYKGVNAQMRDPNGQLFEVQFHTDESFWAKDEGTHDIFEKMRGLERGSDEWARLNQEQMEIAQRLRVPKGIEELKPIERAR
jgi:hypothetical protein